VWVARGFELLINFNKVHWRLPCGMWHICGACVTPPFAPLQNSSPMPLFFGFCLIENRKSTNYEISCRCCLVGIFPAISWLHLLHLAIEQINRDIHPRPLNKPAHQLVFNLRILFPTCSISSLLLISIIYLANKQTTGTESKRNRKLADER